MTGSAPSTRSSRPITAALGLAYPVAWIAILALIGTVTAVLAALGPAWRAGRLRPAEALRFE